MWKDWPGWLKMGLIGCLFPVSFLLMTYLNQFLGSTVIFFLFFVPVSALGGGSLQPIFCPCSVFFRIFIFPIILILYYFTIFASLGIVSQKFKNSPVIRWTAYGLIIGLLSFFMLIKAHDFDVLPMFFNPLILLAFLIGTFFPAKLVIIPIPGGLPVFTWIVGILLGFFIGLLIKISKKNKLSKG